MCWIGVVLGFFTFSTTQEYYSMPAYPAFAMLIGSAMAESGERAWRWATRPPAAIAGCAFLAIAAILLGPVGATLRLAILRRPSRHTRAHYTLSLGHMGDLTIRSFAYLRAAVRDRRGCHARWRRDRMPGYGRGRRAALALAIMMVLFYQAARLALIAFDPYLGSYPLAQALNRLLTAA